MKKRYSAFTALLLALSMVLSLCACQKTADTQKPEEVQAAFDQFTLSVFQEEVSSDLISLHYSLKDPETYGITQYDRTFGTYSLEAMEEALRTPKSRKKNSSPFPMNH